MPEQCHLLPQHVGRFEHLLQPPDFELCDRLLFLASLSLEKISAFFLGQLHGLAAKLGKLVCGCDPFRHGGQTGIFFGHGLADYVGDCVLGCHVGQAVDQVCGPSKACPAQQMGCGGTIPSAGNHLSGDAGGHDSTCGYGVCVIACTTITYQRNYTH